MIKSEFETHRSSKQEIIESDLTIVGGGLSGVCAAITAGREGLKVTLVQDRPVLGGNSSSEVRLWVLGATSHMGNNNRWAREGGVIDELLVENTFRNKEGNPVIFDSLLLDKVVSEPNITLLLNTSIYEVSKEQNDRIGLVKGFCSQNSTEYILKSPLFCDASGDGVLGFLSGAAFRMGAESKEEFGEKFAPSKEYGELLGHSLYFYSKDTGKPVNYEAPSFALTDITKIPRFKSFNAKEYGCKLWWIEYGGRMDTVHDTEAIKWELWKVVYGVWNHIKNSGEFPEAENLTLEWVGMIPGKRESRRFEGDYMLKQQDLVEQKLHEDAVALGGWSIDLHPADGVFSEKPGCNQWHGKGMFQIPYRSLYSRNIKNLFLAGRIISASHIAFASTRVMATCAHMAQAVGMAAKIAHQNGVMPVDLVEKKYMQQLQTQLLQSGQFIPRMSLTDPQDLVGSAVLEASSSLVLAEIPKNDIRRPLDRGTAQMLPVKKGKLPVFNVFLETQIETELTVDVRVSSIKDNHTPDIILETKQFIIKQDQKSVEIIFDSYVEEDTYAFLTFHQNPDINLFCSDHRITGVLSVFNYINKAVSNYGKQTPTEDIGVHEFEFWCPERRPNGHNLAMTINPALTCFNESNLSNGTDRPTSQPNAWVASLDDKNPSLEIRWDKPQEIKTIKLFFDTDFDHPMETVLMSHPENEMPFCIRDYELYDDKNKLIFKNSGNHQSVNIITLPEIITTTKLIVKIKNLKFNVPASLFAIRCYGLQN